LPADKGGAVAARGSVDRPFLDHLLQHPFLQRRPPRSTGLEEFGDRFADQVILEGRERGLEPEGVLATLTMFSATAIAGAVRLLPRVDQIVIAGSGRHNATLLHFLQQELESAPLVSSDTLGLSGDAKEAICFTVLANQTVRGLPATLPSCTRARRPAVLGSITPGSNFQELMRRIGS
jgi:anhydro-N-acetylmuramic acid kinase